VVDWTAAFALPRATGGECLALSEGALALVCVREDASTGEDGEEEEATVVAVVCVVSVLGGSGVGVLNEKESVDAKLGMVEENVGANGVIGAASLASVMLGRRAVGL
jgi:hypothetical protein